MTTREQLEQEAEERYPDPSRDFYDPDGPFATAIRAKRRAHVRAKTIAAEQVQSAACAADITDDKAAAVLEAAGLYIEGEE